MCFARFGAKLTMHAALTPRPLTRSRSSPTCLSKKYRTYDAVAVEWNNRHPENPTVRQSINDYVKFYNDNKGKYKVPNNGRPKLIEPGSDLPQALVQHG